jgi:3-oxoacyl-ACP reductase-like protein
VPLTRGWPIGNRINEHGTEYGNGIKPIFDAKKERRYDSAWNWTRQDCLVLYYDYACGRTR